MGGNAKVEHVFVLMLENRSFDHALGFSKLAGIDAQTGAPTNVNGLSGGGKNDFNGKSYTVAPNAGFSMTVDPKHEFLDVLRQLCWPEVDYPRGGPYPTLTNGGFVASFDQACQSAHKNPKLEQIMYGFAPKNLPVLNALAAEFAVCDAWFASMPGPTWPNRMFVHAGSSAGLDHSPSNLEIVAWETAFGFSFKNGTIFQALKKKGKQYRLYGGDRFPMVAALEGIHLNDIVPYSQFAADVQGNFPYAYVFIEPKYAIFNDYKGGTSEHPLDDIRLGEALIKSTYEAIRKSPLWETSLLIVVWDEHGGFFDHVPPPPAVPPGDSTPASPHNQNGFLFDQYGPRVPAVVVSPWIPKGTIDHRTYDHTSVLKTLTELFGTKVLSDRVKDAKSVMPLLSLSAARMDAPDKLPDPAPGLGAEFTLARVTARGVTPRVPARPEDTINEGSLPVFVQAALRQELSQTPNSEHRQILARVAQLKTRAEAASYLRQAEATLAEKPTRRRKARAQRRRR